MTPPFTSDVWWHRGAPGARGFVIENRLTLGVTLRRSLRRPPLSSYLPHEADGWTAGGCVVLARHLLAWAEHEGVPATLWTVIGTRAAAYVPRPQHALVALHLPGADPCWIDGDGAGRLPEMLERFAADEGLIQVSARPFVSTDARDLLDTPQIDPSFVLALGRTLTPTLATLTGEQRRGGATIGYAARQAPRR